MKTNSKVSKRIISLVLTVLLVLSMVPMSVFSAFAEEVSELSEGLAELSATIDTGAEVTLSDADGDGYYDINTDNELYAFVALVNGGNTGLNAELTTDIVVNEGQTPETARKWTPIGYDYYNSYIGTFDGNDNAVSGLYFNNSEAEYVGLFGYVGENGTVKNTGVTNSYFNGYWDVGGVVGENYGTIENCYNTGTVIGGDCVGGVVGVNVYGTVANCYNTGAISGINNVGGVVGYNIGGTITNCYNTGNVSGHGGVGGVVGYNEGTITNCYNEGYVSGSEAVGGVVGLNYGTITNCYNEGTVSGSEAVGGVVGANSGTITNCYNTGEVSGSDDYVGGVVGPNSGTITNCYYLDTAYKGGINGEDVEGEAEAKTAEHFANGEVAYLLQGTQTTEIWGQKIGTDQLPVLGGAKVYGSYISCGDEMIYSNNADGATTEKPAHNFINGFCTVCGGYEPATLNEDGVYEIGNAGQLYWFADKVNNDYRKFGSADAILTADIVVNEGTMSAESEGAREWTPIGYYDRENYVNYGYSGIFDGNDHTVSGLYFNNSEAEFVGLFGFVGDNGAVKNTGVINSYFNGGMNVGGVVGWNYYGTIENCYNEGIVSGKYFAGGVVGYSNYGTITNCYNTGEVIGDSCVGGVAGESDYGTITNCYNEAEVSGSAEVGGVVGCSYESTIENCYNTGTVSGSDDYVGGVVGDNEGTITNCYYLDTAYKGGINGEDVEGLAEAKTAEQFASGEVAYLLQGTQGELVWGQKIDTDELPTLGGDKVYYGYLACADDATLVYTNNAKATAEKPAHNFVNGFCTVCGALSSSVDADGDGYYDISNADELYAFAALVNSGNTGLNAELTTDIVVNEGTMTAESEGAREWTPIGNNSNKYTGTFNGNNHSVSGLYFNNTESRYVGFFGWLEENGAVENTGVINSYFNGSNYVGVVTGYNRGTIINCYNTGGVSGNNFIGGVVGRNDGTITNCYNTSEVSGYENIGGMAGSNNGTITNCYNTGEVSGSNYIGGVVGRDSGDAITNCYNTGEVSGSGSYVGGVVGYFNGTITNCYNTGDVSSTFKASGVVGYNDNGTTTNCYYLDTACTGGINGEDVEGEAEAKTAEQFASGEVAYLLGEAFGQKLGTDTYPVLGGEKVYYGYVSCSDDAEMIYSNTEISAEKPAHGELRAEFTWDEPYDGECYVSMELYCAECGAYMDYDWGYATLKETVEAEDCMHDGSELYEITFVYNDVNYTDSKRFTLKSDNHVVEFENGFCSACGGYESAKYNEETDVYEISNAGQLYWYAQKLNEENAEIHVKLTDNIVIPEDAPNWTPINCSYAYFDGNFKTISGLKCIDTEATYVGFFGNEGWWYEISNLHITNSYFEGKDCVGAVVACMGNGGFVKNCYVTNTTVKGDSSNVGTLVGYLTMSHIINCYVDTDNLTGYYNSSYGSIENSYYLSDTDDGNGGKTAEQFASGEVAYLLQAGIVGEEIYDEELQEWVTLEPAEIWGQKIGTDTYPVFGGDKVYQVENCIGEPGYSNTDENGQHNYVNGFCTVCDAFEPATLNEDGIYEIGNAGQLYWFAEYVNAGNTSANAILTADITVNEDVLDENGDVNGSEFREWIPIGDMRGTGTVDNTKYFAGVFDGNDYTVSGLYQNNANTGWVGFFGNNDGTIKNFELVDSYFGSTEPYVGVASSVAYINYGTINNVKSYATVSSNGDVGGISGETIGTIRNSAFLGKVVSSGQFGALTRYNDGLIENCYTAGTVFSKDGIYEANFAAINSRNGQIKNCFSYIENDYGFIAVNNGAIDSIENSYYLADTDDGNGGKTAEQFASGEVAYLLQGEQTEEVWGQTIGTDTYPVLGGEKVYMKTDAEGNTVYYNEAVEEKTDKLAGHTISLGDKIAVNYYMSLTEKTVNDANAKMVFTVPDTGSTYTLEIPVSEAVKSGDFYVFTCEVAAKEMTSSISAKLVTSEGELQLKDYTVQDYAEVILANPETYAKEQELVKAMLNYGAQAQLYFNYNTDSLANDTELMTDEEKVIKPYGFPPADVAYSITGEEAGVTYYGTALSLETELEFKHYFVIDESVDVESLKLTCDYPVSLKKNGSLYELKISGIPAHKMAESSLKVTLGGVTLDYTIYSYGAKAYEAGKEELFTLVSALTHFANEATAYTFK